jgi:hypothetical protein
MRNKIKLHEFKAIMMSTFFTNCKDEIIILRLKESLLFRTSDLSAGDKVPDYLDQVSRTDYIEAVFVISSLEAKGIKVAHY